MILWLLFIINHTFTIQSPYIHHTVTIHSPYIHHRILTISTNNHSSNKKCHVTLRPQCGPSSACRDDGSHGESGGRWHAKANLRPGWAMVMKPPKMVAEATMVVWSNQEKHWRFHQSGGFTNKHGGVTNKNSFANENGGWTKQQTHRISGLYTHFHMKPISMAISKSRFGGRWNMLGNRKSWGKHHPKHLANMFFYLRSSMTSGRKIFTTGGCSPFRIPDGDPPEILSWVKVFGQPWPPQKIRTWSSCFCPFEPGVHIYLYGLPIKNGDFPWLC